MCFPASEMRSWFGLSFVELLLCMLGFLSFSLAVPCGFLIKICFGGVLVNIRVLKLCLERSLRDFEVLGS